MSEPVGPPSASPGLASSGGIPWRLVLRREWGLLVLALALSFMVFSLVRSDIDREQVLADIPVTAQAAQPDIQVRFAPGEDRIQLTLFCSQMDYREAERAVSGPDGTPARVFLGDVPATTRPLGTKDRLELPFSPSFVKPGSVQVALASLKGWAYVTEPRTIRYLMPTTIPSAEELMEKYGVTCTLSYAESAESIEGVVFPRSMEAKDEDGKTSIRPDPVDLTPYLPNEMIKNGFEIEIGTPVRFREWRTRGEKDKPDRVWRESMELPARSLKARFEVQKDSWRNDALDNVVVLLVRDPHQFDMQVRDRDRLGMSDLMDRVSGTLGATRDVHEALRAAGERNLVADTLSGWVWGIQITAGEIPTETGQRAELKGRIVFMPLGREFVDASVKFTPEALQSEFPLTLERK